MQIFRSHNCRQKLLVAVMLLGLLLQVQEAFSCEMMASSGPAEHCCCDDMKPAEDTPEPADDSCCEFQNKLAFTGGDLGDDQSVLLPTPTTTESPPSGDYLILAALWPEEPPGSEIPVLWDDTSQPGHPGTKTYLTTLRLRI